VQVRPIDAREAARRVEDVLDAAIAAHQRIRQTAAAPVVRAAEVMRAAIAAGHKVLVFGNGGSAADAQHFAAELVGRFQQDRAGLPAIALTVDGSTMTSVANDYGFDRVFARQVEALGRAGDVAVGISTSGASPNVLAAFGAARQRGLRTIAFTGRDGGALGQAADVHINVADASTARVQEVHRTLIHALCEIIERAVEE
jgi:D-sedoheptulose 7-phosphate isomerase